MIDETVIINRPVSVVYEAFRDLSVWKRVLPDVLDVTLIYESPEHQEFLMTVRRPKGAETIRGIRFCQRNARLELVQPQPPPGFRRMSGVWQFRETSAGTEVTASRSFELAPVVVASEPRGSTESVGEMIRGYLRANLNHFKHALEAAPCVGSQPS